MDYPIGDRKGSEEGKLTFLEYTGYFRVFTLLCCVTESHHIPTEWTFCTLQMTKPKLRHLSNFPNTQEVTNRKTKVWAQVWL